MPLPAVNLSIGFLTQKPNCYVSWPMCDLILVKLVPVVTNIFYSPGFSGHCLLWSWPLTFWTQTPNSTSMNPNTYVTKFPSLFFETRCSQYFWWNAQSHSLTVSLVDRYHSGTDLTVTRHENSSASKSIKLTKLKFEDSSVSSGSDCVQVGRAFTTLSSVCRNFDIALINFWPVTFATAASSLPISEILCNQPASP